MIMLFKKKGRSCIKCRDLILLKDFLWNDYIGLMKIESNLMSKW